MSHSFSFDFPLVNGLHARPATSLAGFCESFEAEILCTNRRNGCTASARSVLALISADIRHTDSCELAVEGTDAEAALAALRHFVTEDLAHGDDELAVLDEPDAAVELPRSLKELSPSFITGFGLAPGIAQGEPLVLSGLRFPAPLLDLPGEGADEEWRRLSLARASVVQGLESELSSRSGTEAAVLKAHLAILQDEEYSAWLHKAVNQAGGTGSSAKAIATVVQHFDHLLGQSANPYLAERALDIQDVSQRLMRTIYGDDARAPLPVLAQASIIIADTLTPGDFIALNGPGLKGLVLESGGRTSHTVLLARAAGIPTLLGATGAASFASASPGTVILDAGAGLLLRGSDSEIIDYYQRELIKLKKIESRFEAFNDTHASTSDGVRIEVATNISLPEEADGAFAAGAEGIGLFRTEMLFAGREEAPGEEEQFDAYRQALAAANGRPVVIRTFDIGGDKPVPWLNSHPEENPFLGERGARLYPVAEAAFRTQLRALMRASRFGDLRIMIPMISTTGELKWVRAVFDEMCEEFREATGQAESPQFGMMIEVPSAVFSIDHLAPMCDFFSIGSNDLSQYFLASDRGNNRLRDLYSHFQPAFLRLLRKLVDDVRARELPLGLCGEMASDELALPLLAGLGLDEISLTAPQILRAKSSLSRLDSGACRDLLNQALDCEDEGAVRQLLEKFAVESVDSALFDKDLIVFSASAANKTEAIKQLVDRVHLAGRVENCAALENAVWQREDVFSTGLGFGIAIPHCKSSAVKQNSLCVARYATPLDWSSRDGEPVDTVIMLIVRESDAGEVHMKIFAQLARKIMHEEFRAGLRACPDEKSLLQYLQSAVEE